MYGLRRTRNSLGTGENSVTVPLEVPLFPRAVRFICVFVQSAMVPLVYVVLSASTRRCSNTLVVTHVDHAIPKDGVTFRGARNESKVLSCPFGRKLVPMQDARGATGAG